MPAPPDTNTSPMTDTQLAATARTPKLLSHRASIIEVIIVAAIAVGALRFFMGWDWSNVAPNGVDPGPFADSSVDTRHGLGVGIVAALGIVWLALRGRAVFGAIAVFAPIIVVSGWRMADGRAIGANMWPIGLGILIFFGAIGCAVFGAIGTAIRRRLLGARATV